MTVGRPRWIPTEENINEVERLASNGLNKTQIADCLGIGYSTLKEKCNSYPDFAAAYKRGKAKGIAHVTDALLKNVNIGNPTSQIFFLKCRAGWKEAYYSPQEKELRRLFDELQKKEGEKNGKKMDSESDKA